MRYLQSADWQDTARVRDKSEQVTGLAESPGSSGWHRAPADIPDGAATSQRGTTLTFEIKLGVRSHCKGMCVYIPRELQEYLVAECAELFGFAKRYQLTEQIINGTDTCRGREV